MSHLTRRHLSEVIGERTLHVTDQAKLTNAIAAYLLFEHKTADLEPLMRDVMQYRLEHGAVEVMAITAHQLSDDIKTEIEQLMKQQYPGSKDVVIDEVNDPSVVGGVRLQLPNEQLDLSVASKINTFKRLTAQETTT